jgi:hypothetical protein
MEQTKADSTKQPSKTETSNSNASTSSTNNLQTNNPISRKLNKILESRIENDKVNLFEI